MAGDRGPLRIAGIDIGTNTVLLLVAEVDPHGELTVLADEQAAPRIGRNVDAAGNIGTPAFDALAGVVGRYRARAESLGAHLITACATSAVRTAANAPKLLRHVLEHTGIGIEVLSGGEEALLTYRGVVSGLRGQSGWSPSGPAPPLTADPAILDIGGGSTEISYAPPGGINGGRRVERFSMELGSVRLTERFFRRPPASPGEVASARAQIVEELAAVRNPGFDRYALVGVAGTATTLAALHLGLNAFDAARIEACRMSAREVSALTSRLLGLEPAAIRGLSAMTEGREDILAAGALILHAVMDHLGFGELGVSTRGLRHGIVLREWARLSGRAYRAS